MSKKVVSFFVCLILLFSISTSALSVSAASNISYASSNLSISGGKAYISCSLTGYQGTTIKCKISAYLQQYKNGSWVTIGSWSKTSNMYRATLDVSKAVSKGYKYRVYAYFYGTSATTTQSISLASNTISY